jgi:hypothetical protein
MQIRQLPCFHTINWNPDRRERCRFAVAMLAGFVVLGGLKAIHQHHLSAGALALGGTGAALALAALPSALGRAIYLGIYLPTSVVGFIVSRTLLTLIFFALFAPLGLLLRRLEKDLLRLNPRGGESDWIARGCVRDASGYYRQF